MTVSYDSDFYGWTQEQADLLRSGRLTELDIQNLLEEIEAMGRSAENELESRLQVLFMHLLKWEYQPSRRGKSWQLTIEEQRRKIERRLNKSPSLKHKLPDIIDDAYGDAVIAAERETGLERSVFPTNCPWSLEEALNKALP
ncbi:uncharacterized protein DUF29 [Azomonas agilis]|uniref:Uncharacterized protein DUF29 n=1 Tax=Azomonas agilis TaxID=116849 RepID=A0A562IJU0_9GAMM|nr:DUF29 domain-containing protein [Azomonas agilis]TWH71291.1 uncharacterized protein DUF29 [Azomonas agilis]